MSSLRPQDRKSLCRFSFANGRQCRTPRSPHHPHFCSDHARKDSQARAAGKLALELSYFFSGQYLSACDLGAALGRLLPGIVRGDIKPRPARTLAYLSQTLAQTIHLSQHEYTNALGTDSWRRAIRNSVRQNFDYRNDSPPPELPQTPPQTPTAIPLESTLIEMPALFCIRKKLNSHVFNRFRTLRQKTGGGYPQPRSATLIASIARTRNREQVAENQPPVASHQSPVTSHFLWYHVSWDPCGLNAFRCFL
jgi:hypothetical protein